MENVEKTAVRPNGDSGASAWPKPSVLEVQSRAIEMKRQPRLRRYFYTLLGRYFSFFVLPGSRVLLVAQNEVEIPLPRSCDVKRVLGEDVNPVLNEIAAFKPDYIILLGTLHFVKDIQSYLTLLAAAISADARVLTTYYSSLWKPVLKFATWIGLQNKGPETNWISPLDFQNFLDLAGFQKVSSAPKVLLPIWFPLISTVANRWLAPLPLFRNFSLVNLAVIRAQKQKFIKRPSVSVVVAARNEAGNMEELARRVPKMGPEDELILIEGGSTDSTWEVIQKIKRSHPERIIKIGQQEGRGKGDAVRKGFSMADGDILMILDADMTVKPEDLPKFYRALVDGPGEFINGSRLVYPMEKRAMRFFNILGNHFFARAFSFLLGQPLKDTLCGTKVLTRANYNKLAKNRSYFGEFDPFGDFDLIFGAARLGLKIIELPIRYQERVYGETNIQRWRHGVILLRMVMFAARRIKFI